MDNGFVGTLQPVVECLYVICNVDPWRQEFNWNSGYYGYPEDFYKLEIDQEEDGTITYAMSFHKDKEHIYSAQLKMIQEIRKDFKDRIESLQQLSQNLDQEEEKIGNCSKLLDGVAKKLEIDKDTEEAEHV